MRTGKSRTISRTRLSVLALAGAVAAVTASQGAFAMLTAEDLERARAHDGSQGIHAVSLGKPGHVILKRETRAKPLGYSTTAGPVGRVPVDKGKDRD